MDKFEKNTQISNFMKIRPVRAELFHVDGRADMTKLMVVSRSVANAPKNCPVAPRIYRLICPVGCNYYKEFQNVDL